MSDQDQALPLLEDVATEADVSQKGGGSYSANFINWARVMHYLRTEAPGWQPFAKQNDEGGITFAAPDGSVYLQIGFLHVPSQRSTTLVIHGEGLGKHATSRDIADAFVRGCCKAAAFHFGLAWQLWSKEDPMARPAPPAKEQGETPVDQEAQARADMLRAIFTRLKQLVGHERFRTVGQQAVFCAQAAGVECKTGKDMRGLDDDAIAKIDAAAEELIEASRVPQESEDPAK